MLVNNAAVSQVGPATEMTADDYDLAMRTIFWAALHATTAALPHFRRVGGGRVANVASIGGKIAVPHLLPYSAAKFALVGLGEGAAGRTAAGEGLRDDGVPGADPHGQPADRDL